MKNNHEFPTKIVPHFGLEVDFRGSRAQRRKERQNPTTLLFCPKHRCGKFTYLLRTHTCVAATQTPEQEQPGGAGGLASPPLAGTNSTIVLTLIAISIYCGA